jgi:aminopeptidase N
VRATLAACRARSAGGSVTLSIAFSILALTGLSAQDVNVWSRPVQSERSRSFDFLHYRVSLTFDLEAQIFHGENRITLTPLAGGLDHFELDAEELTIQSVLDAEGRALAVARSDTSVVVLLRDQPAVGDTLVVTVRYRGEGSREGFFFDEASDEHPQMVSTDSWPDEARHWIPLYDYPNDKVTHELIVTVPEGNRVLSNGRLVGVREDDASGTATWHWSQERPHATYLMMLAIGPFAVIRDSLGDLPVSYWVYPDAVEDARWIFAKTPRMIAYYADLFDYPYPWAKYDQVTTPHVGGGAEATSATILGDGVIHDRRAEQDFSWERIIAHEVAHQWWGDLITLREWSHAWLNESFGTYSDYLWTRHESGGDEGAWALSGKKNAYLREARTSYMRPIVHNRYERPHDNFDSHTYPKGAAILHQLRFLLGDESFFRALSAFLHDHAFQPVDTYDFMKTVKEVTGQNLDWFFEQFVFSAGHPVFEVSSAWDAEAGEIRLSVAQVQDRARGVPVYRTPVQIGIVTESGKRVETVWLEDERDSFVFPSSEEPLLVRFDEGNWLLKEWTYQKSVEELLYQARHDDVIGREWAVRGLAGFGEHPGVADLLASAVHEDPFWAVRVAAVETLASTRGPGAAPELRAAAADERSEVRRAAIRSLGSLGRLDTRGDTTLVPFFRDVFASDSSYQVQAEALRAIGRVGDRSQLDFLRQASGIDSPRDVIHAAAAWAVEEIDRGSG